tara:strand:+ start:26840 stop:27514 length:675 start_codon:yes stop_codon:yes gene_type:complete
MNMDLNKIDSWVFDLDNTLYSAETGIFDQVDKLMGEYIVKYLNVDISEAKIIQKKYFKEHGTTLKGLMDNYNIIPEHFLDEVHKLDYSIIKPNLELKKALNKIKSEKIIFTNANRSHVNAILDRLEINGAFDGIFDITDANYIPKPEMISYENLIKKFNIDKNKTIMFDDIAKNLVPASKIGFKTVWIDTGNENYSDDIANSRKYLDYETTDLPLWLNSIIKES